VFSTQSTQNANLANQIINTATLQEDVNVSNVIRQEQSTQSTTNVNVRLSMEQSQHTMPKKIHVVAQAISHFGTESIVLPAQPELNLTQRKNNATIVQKDS